MDTTIQSSKKRFTHQFWKGDSKRRNSTPNLKKEGEIASIDSKPSLNYQIEEQKKLLIDYRAAKDKYVDFNEDIIQFIPYLDLCKTPRVTRTIKVKKIDNIDANYLKLEPFHISYCKDFIVYKSPQEDLNKFHLKSLSLTDCFPADEIPVYDSNSDTNLTSSPNDIMEQWANQTFSKMQPDPLITGLLNSASVDSEERQSRKLKDKSRQQKLFVYYIPQDYITQIESKGTINPPQEVVGKSLKVHIKSFHLNPDLEPIFGKMCLYDLKNKKKISENFYFDLNSKSKFHILDPNAQLSFIDRAPQANSCIFHVSHPSDIFLVIRIEKILQKGDANDIAESYLKDDKHKSKLKTEIEWAWKHHPRFRMPLGFQAIELNSFLAGYVKNPSFVQSSNSIDNCSLNSKTSLLKSSRASINVKNHPLESATTKMASQSLSKDMYLLPSHQEEDNQSTSLFQNVAPKLTNLNFFYRQEYDRLSDEDLFKWLLECKKPGSSSNKKLKMIPCNMELEISTIDELNSSERILSPEELVLATKRYQQPKSSKSTVIERPIIDTLEFPAEKVFAANSMYRNLLYVYPKSVNFGSKQGSYRNIAVKTEVLHVDGEAMKTLRAIYSKVYESKFAPEAFTKVLYHIKSPDFNDEIKIKIPLFPTGEIVLLFTFFHISCQSSKKHESPSSDVIIGYSWLPIFDNGILRPSEHSLMISTDKPNCKTAIKKPDLQTNIENTSWLESHKELFRVSIHPVSTLYSDDSEIEKFNKIVVLLRSLSKNPSEDYDVNSLRNDLDDALKMLDKCKLDALMQFSFVILDNLLWLAVDLSFNLFIDQPEMRLQILDILAGVVNRITIHSTNKLENLNRDAVLSTYVHYCASLPEMIKDAEVQHNSNVQPQAIGDYTTQSDIYTSTGLFHEDLLSQILQCIDNDSHDNIFDNLWFFLELIIRGMREYFFYIKSHLKEFNRKNVFSNNFLKNLSHLIKISNKQVNKYIQSKDYGDESITIISPQKVKKLQNLVRNLALFINDLVTMLHPNIIKSYIVDFIIYINSKINNESKHIVYQYVKSKLEFLRIISCCEYFLILDGINLPKDSKSNVITEAYVIKHLILSLIFIEIKLSWQTRDPILQDMASQIILNLLASHESDPRYDSRETIYKISDIYLPFINVLFDFTKCLLPQRSTHNKLSSCIGTDNCSISSFDYTYSRTSFSTYKSIVSDSLYEVVQDEFDNYPWNGMFDQEDSISIYSKHLLLCYVWILKNLDYHSLISWFQDLPTFKINKILYLLLLTVVHFEYKGNNDGRLLSESSFELSTPEEILKESESSSKVNYVKDMAFVAEMVLCREIIFVVIDTLEIILKMFENSSNGITIVINILRVIIKTLCLNHSVAAIQRLLSFQRLLVRKHHRIIFDENIDLCGDLCKCLLHLAAANLKEIRSQAVASLYMLMRLNFHMDNTFARIKLQITVALSRLVCDTSKVNRKKNIELNLNRSLRTIIAYSTVDTDLLNERNQNGDEAYFDYTSFTTQVQELIQNLNNILNDIMKMRQFQKDPVMQIDLMSRIAKGYQNSPDLRLTWLQMMEKKHVELNNDAEAGMCIAHCAAIVAEYLGMKEPLPFMPIGCVQLSDALGINLLEESATSDDVVSPDEDGVCCDPLFSKENLVKLIRKASKYFHKAGMFELLPKLSRIFLPIVEEQRDYSRLSKFHGDIKEAYDNIISSVNRRIFSTYFRVGFYGKGFQDLDNQEFVYKEAPFAKLPEVSSKIELFYSDCFGKENLVIIKDSSNVDLSTLDGSKNYIQIIFVEPYFETAELRRRVNTFEQNYNLKKFVYSTPYTSKGKSHGELKDQYKRKTILYTEKSFPYIKTRILVVKRTILNLDPIEVALEDLSKKVEQLSVTLTRKPIDAKYLQMMLQGAIGTTVNQGPVELANSFLTPSNSLKHGYHYNKLKLCFKEFLRRCHEGLEKNKNLITNDQNEYQKELERNFVDISNKLAPLLYPEENFNA